MKKEKEIWNYSIDQIICGFSEQDGEYRCVICGETFEKGSIYPIEDGLYDAYGAVKRHRSMSHGDMTDYMLRQEPGLIGVSEVQRQILQLLSDGKNDKDIAAAIGIAQSTVRNHRFKLREKEKQAKLYLAMLAALELKTKIRIENTADGTLEEVHASATMVDERYGITEQERLKTIHIYMNENGALKQIPVKEKKKIILLREIMKNFKHDIDYTEGEINKVLKRIYEADYPSIRRYLIEYGFMDRSPDCSVYRVKE